MAGRSQPRRIIERARPDPHHAIPRRAGNPSGTFGANPPRVGSPTIGGALKWTRLDPAHPKGCLGNDDPRRERAARQALTGSAMTGVDQLRGFGDRVADFAA